MSQSIPISAACYLHVFYRSITIKHNIHFINVNLLLFFCSLDDLSV